MIALRTNWNGNEPSFSTLNPLEAIAFMKSHPTGCYEVLKNDVPVRPYGDVDVSLPVGALFQEKRDSVLQSIVKMHTDIAVSESSDSSKGKISFHWCIPTEWVSTTAHAKQYAQELYNNMNGADYSVYDPNKKMRTLFASKPNQNRPFITLDCEPIDTIIQYVPPTAIHKDIRLRQVQRKIYERPNAGAGTPQVEREVKYCSETIQLAELVNTTKWDDRTTCRNLIWSLCAAKASNEQIHFYAKKSSKYDETFVNELIRTFVPNCISPATLLYHAREDNPSAVEKITGATANACVAEMTALNPDENMLLDWCDEKGYLRPLPNVPTSLVKSMMGTGKTEQMKQIAKGVPKYIIISARCSYADKISTDFPDCRDYRKSEDKKKSRTITDDKVICSIQSLWRIDNASEFDTVFLDESETLLASCSTNKTHNGHYFDNVSALERIVRTAKKVVAMDAFTTERSRQFLEALRPTIQIIINPHKPRKCTSELYTRKAGGQIYFHQRICELVKEKKKVLAVFGTKKAAIHMHEAITKITSSAVLYHGGADCDAKMKALHFGDVNKYWAPMQVVSFTPVATVGLSYDIPKPCFDVCTFEASAYAAPFRDTIQSMHRARKLNDNHIVGYVETMPNAYNTQTAGLRETEQYYNEDISKSAELLSELGEEVLDYERLPSWLIKILIFNVNEQITNWKYPKQCAEYYLTECGIDINYVSVVPSEKSAAFLKSAIADNRELDNIEDICDDEADVLMRKRCSTDLTVYDTLKLSKWRLANLGIPRETIDGTILREFIDNERLVENAYNEKHSDPRALLEKLNRRNNTKIIDLVAPEIKQLVAIQSLALNYEDEIHIPIFDVIVPDLSCFGVRNRTKKIGKAQECRQLAKAICSFNGAKFDVKQVRVRTEGGREYEYFLHYEPDQSDIVAYIPKKNNIRNMFARDE